MPGSLRIRLWGLLQKGGVRERSRRHPVFYALELRMADYWCSHCGARTAMMGHRDDRHDTRLLGIIDRVVNETGARRNKVVEAVGMWQIGEIQLPE